MPGRMVFLGLLWVPFGLLANQSVDQQLRVLVQKAQAAEQKDDLEEAAALYRQMLKIRPHWASAEFNLGLVCHSQKKYWGAIRLMPEATRHRPAFADAYL